MVLKPISKRVGKDAYHQEVPDTTILYFTVEVGQSESVGKGQ